MLKQLGGMSNIMEMVKGLQEGGGMEEMMSKMMGGGMPGGLGGMGGMEQMAKMMMGGGGMKMPPGMPKGMMKMRK